ncbi:TonB-dependent receptor domain-containing protein [Silvibacterium acidisoli]|uniref:TonB-dependent receptor domain-containing protein n=1 Tax=Acidobacteriaceae bacterium ZG23-2 TaxID=2883246 RepID=UPI00406D042B
MLKRLCLLCAFVCLLSSYAFAQTTNATLLGTVTDTSGAVVAGAQVTLLEPKTGRTVRQITSKGDGGFEFDELLSGTYELHASATSFKMFVAKDVVLDSGQVRRLDPQLALGQAVEEVTVNAGAAVINTENATLTALFTAKEHDQSPQVTIYPSTWYQLTTLAGVQGGTYPPVADGETAQNQTQTFDGIPNDLNGIQNNNANFYEQVSATLFNAPAESPVPFEMNQVTKRGQNALHGKATYRIYDSVFDATGYFNTTKSPYIQHEWDLEASGPIWKDHTFFYAGWFAQRIPLGTLTVASVPSNAWRNGVFSQTIIDPTTGQPFPNNTIPANRISPVSLAVQNNYLPAANIDPNGTVNNYQWHFPFNSDLFQGDWPIVRIDHTFSPKDSVFVRWMFRRTPYVLSDGLPSAVWTRLRHHGQTALGETHVFSPTLINNLRLGYSTDYIIDGTSQAGQTPPDGSQVLSAIGLQGANPSGLTGQGLPEFDISGLTSLADVSGGVKDNNKIFNLVDTVDWQFGQHSIKFGGGVEKYHNFYGVVPYYGDFVFDGSVTAVHNADGTTSGGNAYADFLLGYPQSDSRQTPLNNRSQDLTEYSLFAEDSWKATRKLTVNYGIRWDFYGTPYADDHLMYNFDPASGDVIVDPKGISKVSPLYPSNIPVVAGAVQAIAEKNNIVPRIGVAYQLSDNSVVRAGYGIFTTRLGTTGGLNNFLPINPQLGSTGPFSITEGYLNTYTPGVQPLLSFPNPFPGTGSAPSQSVNGYDRQTNHGTVQQYNVTYEREIAHIGLRVSYLGSVGGGLNYSVNTNLPHPSTTPFVTSSRPYPELVSTTMLKYDGSSHFNSFQLEAKRRVGHLTFSASYSLSSSLANYLDVENPYDVLGHWANDGQTRRNYFSGNLVYALPFGKNQRFLADGGKTMDDVVGGWSLSVLQYVASGLGFSPAYSGSDASNTGTEGGLPDLVGNPNSIPGGKNYYNWFNTAAFAVPQPGTFGNARPNSLEGQHLYQTHLSLTKSVAITDRVHFNFVTQMSNIFNHPQFLNPSGNISVAGGNQFTSQYGTFDSLESGQQRQITFLGGFTF